MKENDIQHINENPEMQNIHFLTYNINSARALESPGVLGEAFEDAKFESRWPINERYLTEKMEQHPNTLIAIQELDVDSVQIVEKWLFSKSSGLAVSVNL